MATTAAELRKRYEELAAKSNQSRVGFGSGSSQAPLLAAHQAWVDAVNAERQGAKGAGGGTDRIEESRKKILDYTAGRGDAAMNDAMINSALGRLDKVSSGADAPFTQQVQNQMLAERAGASASAMGSQSDMLAMQAASLGGSMADPAYQAKLRQLNAQRQSTNLTAQGQIGTTAQLENFGARQTATNSMLGGRMGQHALANTGYSQAAQFLGNDSASDGHVSGTWMPQQSSSSSSSNFTYNPRQVQNQDWSTNYGAQPAAAKPATSAQGQPTPPMQTTYHTNNGGYNYQQPSTPVNTNYRPTVQGTYDFSLKPKTAAAKPPITQAANYTFY